MRDSVRTWNFYSTCKFRRSFLTALCFFLRRRFCSHSSPATSRSAVIQLKNVVSLHLHFRLTSIFSILELHIFSYSFKSMSKNMSSSSFLSLSSMMDRHFVGEMTIIEVTFVSIRCLAVHTLGNRFQSPKRHVQWFWRQTLGFLWVHLSHKQENQFFQMVGATARLFAVMFLKRRFLV